jgi:hypothetical protein
VGNDHLARLMDDLEAEATPIVLPPFDLEETTTFLAAHGLDGRDGRDGPDRVDDGMAAAVHRAPPATP